MKDKLKRILALLGAILLLGLYISTIIFALMKSELANSLLKASILCTFIIPVFIYAYTLTIKWQKNKRK